MCYSPVVTPTELEVRKLCTIFFFFALSYWSLFLWPAVSFLNEVSPPHGLVLGDEMTSKLNVGVMTETKICRAIYLGQIWFGQQIVLSLYGLSYATLHPGYIHFCIMHVRGNYLCMAVLLQTSKIWVRYTVITARKLVTPTRYFVSLAIGKLKHVAGHTWVSIGCMEVGCMS